MTTRSMAVPEGLAGMRIDAGLARLLGLSRTVAATLAEQGGVEVDGVAVGKSDRLTAGAWLEVELPEEPAPLENPTIDVEGMTILYADADIVAVDKPAGVAAHASQGWTGPTVLGGLAAAIFWRKGNPMPIVVGMLTSLIVMTGVQVLPRLELTKDLWSRTIGTEIYWPWYTLIGTTVTLGTAWLVRRFLGVTKPAS